MLLWVRVGQWQRCGNSPFLSPLHEVSPSVDQSKLSGYGPGTAVCAGKANCCVAPKVAVRPAKGTDAADRYAAKVILGGAFLSALSAVAMTEDTEEAF